MKQRNDGIARRVLIGLALPLLLLLLILYERSGGTGIVCRFHELTGLYCPGCGSGRAVLMLLQGNWRAAFQSNILLLPLGIPSAGIVLYEYLRIVFFPNRWKPVNVPQPVVIAVTVLIFLFWILRNIPQFSILSPHG